MILRNLPFLAIALLFLAGCSATVPDSIETRGTEGVARTVKEVIITGGTPMTLADISIEGMSCEMMCGGSIRKALARLPGVSGTEIRFSEEEVRDHAIVTYDDTKVTDAQMIEAIQALYDGQYRVTSVEITQQVQGTSTPQSSKVENEEKGMNVYAPAISIIPSILALLTQIMRL